MMRWNGIFFFSAHNEIVLCKILLTVYRFEASRKDQQHGKKGSKKTSTRSGRLKMGRKSLQKKKGRK